MASSVDEWFRQADYDLETAEYMLTGDRRFYSVFMAHLAVEKALKGAYQKRLSATPPRIHNLMMLIERMQMQPPAGMEGFLLALTQAQTDARYGDELKVLLSRFTAEGVRETLAKAKEIMRWAKTL